MIVVLSDTHGCESHRLEGRTREAVREATLVCHCGDFVTEAVLDALGAVVADAGGRFVAVAGNNDRPAVRERASETETVEHADTGRRVRIPGTPIKLTDPNVARSSRRDRSVGSTSLGVFGIPVEWINMLNIKLFP